MISCSDERTGVWGGGVGDGLSGRDHVILVGLSDYRNEATYNGVEG